MLNRNGLTQYIAGGTLLMLANMNSSPNAVNRAFAWPDITPISARNRRSSNSSGQILALREFVLPVDLEPNFSALGFYVVHSAPVVEISPAMQAHRIDRGSLFGNPFAEYDFDV